MLVKVPVLADELGTISQARSGDPQALAALYDMHADAVYATAINILRSRADAEDVLQDVFLGLPEALKRFEARGTFIGWLKRVTVRVALMKLRSQSRRREAALAELPDVTGSTDRLIDRVELERALARIPEKLQVAFILKEIEGYSHEETASFLGISTEAVRARLFRAKRQLRQLLKRP